MNFGIVGFGRMGQVYKRILEDLGIKIEFIVDVNPEKIDENYLIFSDYKEALESKKIDGLVISTYGPSHFDIIKYAIKKNIKYIACEKPFTTSVSHANEITELVRSKEIRLSVNYIKRFSSAYKNLMTDLYEEQIIGKPKTVIIISGAGGLSTVGTHYFDLCSFLLKSKVKTIFAISVDKKLTNPRGSEFNEPGGYAMINYENDGRVFIDMSDDLGLNPVVEIIGEHGRVRINEIEKTILITCRTNEDKDKAKNFYGLPNPIIKNERFELEEVEELTKKMIENLISDSELISTSELGYQSVEIYSAIRKAFEEKCIVNFPLEGKYYEMVFSVT